MVALNLLIFTFYLYFLNLDHDICLCVFIDTQMVKFMLRIHLVIAKILSFLHKLSFLKNINPYTCTCHLTRGLEQHLSHRWQLPNSWTVSMDVLWPWS